ncbi:hypothetical protein CL3_06660 [butyrate-producing bacterium SM4/1]|nr:hypothetical protein CL3_06660 [butyrate-producing bacterium SM4/1]
MWELLQKEMKEVRKK